MVQDQNMGGDSVCWLFQVEPMELCRLSAPSVLEKSKARHEKGFGVISSVVVFEKEAPDSGSVKEFHIEGATAVCIMRVEGLQGLPRIERTAGEGSRDQT